MARGRLVELDEPALVGSDLGSITYHVEEVGRGGSCLRIWPQEAGGRSDASSQPATTAGSEVGIGARIDNAIDVLMITDGFLEIPHRRLLNGVA